MRAFLCKAKEMPTTACKLRWQNKIMNNYNNDESLGGIDPDIDDGGDVWYHVV
ncbi:hypothetical protein ACFLRB_03020 [Acidobacteriota bacterium]